jgi:hypothetical protein
MKYRASNPTDENVYFPLSQRTLIAGERDKIVEYNGDVANLIKLGLEVEAIPGTEGATDPEPQARGKNKRGKR